VKVWWRRRSTKRNAVATLAVFVILGLVNFLAVYPVRRDFTETQLFTLAPQSRQLVQEFAEPVRCGCLTLGSQDRQLLENYPGALSLALVC